MITTLPQNVFRMEWSDHGVWEPVVPAEATIYNLLAGRSYKFYIFGALWEQWSPQTQSWRHGFGNIPNHNNVEALAVTHA